MVCLACISVFGFLIALVAKFLGEFLGIGYFKSKDYNRDPEERDMHKEKPKGHHNAAKKEAQPNAEEEDENPFAQESAFDAGKDAAQDAPKCPFSAAAQGKAKKRD